MDGKQKIMDIYTPLQRKLISDIVRLIHEDNLHPGDHLNELQFAQRLNVSRTPLRSALEALEKQGFIKKRPNRGMEIISIPPLAEPDEDPATDKALLVRIARDRHEGKLPEEFSEASLSRIYDIDRKTIRELMLHLEELNLIERRSGYGWRFLDDYRDAAHKSEGRRFRVVLECGALLEPGYKLDKIWAKQIRESHERIMNEKWQETSAIEFVEMNCEFHEGICAGANNRFILNAIIRQNQLRRLSQYHWRHGFERVLVSCQEHMEILDWLLQKENKVAAALLQRHLELTNKQHLLG